MENEGAPLSPLYLGTKIEDLDAIIQNDGFPKTFKRSKLTNKSANSLASKVKNELFQCQNDQEKCYVLCRRYLNFMNYLFKICDDKTFIQQLYATDIKRVNGVLDNLTRDLEIRYKQLEKETAIREKEQQVCKEVLRPSFESHTRKINSNNRSERALSKELKKKNPYFTDIFITPTDLFQLLSSKSNMLLVDIRDENEFKECCVVITSGVLINIPGRDIVPGLSANTLGNCLRGPIKKIWDNRDKFDVIVLMDAETERYNYQGSILERLRSCIVDWDVNRTYVQDPVVLDGGLREYVEFYPTAVTDSVIYMSRHNCEMDELLNLETISYPESGRAVSDNLRTRLIDSMMDVESRINRDFPGDAHLVENETLAPGDYDTTKILSATDILSDSSESPRTLLYSEYASLEVPVEEEEVENDKPCPLNMTDLMKAALEAEKADLIRKARATKKPGYTPQEPQPKIAPPPIRRETKPTIKLYKMMGEGITGIKNCQNNCFISSILQCLKCLPLIKEMYVKTNHYLLHTRSSSEVNTLFANTMKILWKGTLECPEIYWPANFKTKIDELNPIYNKHRHEDAFEFFIFLFDALSNECADNIPCPKIMTDVERGWYTNLNGRSSFLIEHFYHQIRNSKTCRNCRKVSLNFDVESTLMLPVPQIEASLQHLVDDYMKDTIVNDYCCTNCKCKASIVNKRNVVLHPDVLVIVLKRYGQFSDGSFGKLNTPISFPLENLTFGLFNYSLQAFVHHVGSLSAGHYFASVQLDNDKWAVCNDERIQMYSNFKQEYLKYDSEATGFFFVKQKGI